MGLLVGVNFPPPGTFEKKGGTLRELIKKELPVLLALLVLFLMFMLA